jgi:uncharacterized membrane protein
MNRKHLVMMGLGCLLPLIALTAIFLFQVKVSSILLFGLVLLCPLMHLWMMRDHSKHEPNHKTVETSDLSRSVTKR